MILTNKHVGHRYKEHSTAEISVQAFASFVLCFRQENPEELTNFFNSRKMLGCGSHWEAKMAEL